MNQARRLALQGIVCLLVIFITVLWAPALMDSLYNYRSPLSGSSLPPGSPPLPPLARRVVAVLVDGLRVDTAADASVMPFLNSLRARGASATVHSHLPAYSTPGWSVLAIGAWPDLSDAPAMNPTSPGDYTWTQDNLYDAARRAGLRTAASASESFKYLIPAASLDSAAWTVDETPVADQQNIDQAVAWVKSGQYQYIFTYMVQVDHAGHYQGGPRDPRWNEAARRCDELLAQLVGALDLAQDTVLVYSDHGHIDQGGHGGQEPVVLVQPFVMAGAAVRPGAYGDIQMVDVAPTTAVLLGASLPAMSQGRARTEMLNLSTDQQAAVLQATLRQQAALYQAYAQKMGAPLQDFSASAAADPVTVYQSAIETIRSDRLAGERQPRAGLVALLAAALLIAVVHLRPGGLVLMGLLVNVAAFHLLYTGLFGGTYTLSSVLSDLQLLVSVGVSAVGGLLAAWIVNMYAWRYRQLPPRQAVYLHLQQVMATLFVAGLPALWSLAYNGPLLTWTIPDVPSMFYGFLSLVACLSIAAAGLLLAGVTDLIARHAPPAKAQVPVLP